MKQVSRMPWVGVRKYCNYTIRKYIKRNEFLMSQFDI